MVGIRNFGRVILFAALYICLFSIAAIPAFAAATISASISSAGILQWSPAAGAKQYWYSIDGSYKLADDGVFKIDIKSIIDKGVVPADEGLEPEYKNTGSHEISIEAYDDNGTIAVWEGTYDYLSPAAPKVEVPTGAGNKDVKGIISKDGILSWDPCENAASYTVGLNGMFTPVKEGEFNVSLDKLISDLAVIGSLKNKGTFKVELQAIDADGFSFSTWEGSYTSDVHVDLKSKDVVILDIKDRKYTGKAIKPKLTITYQSLKLKRGTDYTVTYKNNQNVGKATVTIKGKGLYKGTVKKTFNINPRPTTIKKTTALSKQIKLTWTKQKAQLTGYEVQYSKKKNFKTNVKTITIKKKTIGSKKITKLKAGTYYVRVRTYKTVKGSKYFSTWSKAAKVTVN